MPGGWRHHQHHLRKVHVLEHGFKSSFLHVHVTAVDVENHPLHGFLHAVLLHRNLLSLALHKLVAAEHGGEEVTGNGQDSKHDVLDKNYLEIIEAAILSEDQKNVDAAASYGRRLLLRQDPVSRQLQY